MENRNICNFINFVRGVCIQHPEIEYMLTPVREQTRLMKQYGFEGTFLLQYDALIDDRFTDFLKNEADSSIEIGGWFEITKQLVDLVGIEWRGREGFTWDWHNEVGFLIGYTPKQRQLLIDAYFCEFKKRFGYYPNAVGSWHIDAFSLNYMYEKYNIVASCMCREQVGTDGYTLWGGYRNAYYPSKKNMFCPANSKEEQIDVPLFRMLGEDVLYNYDHPYLSKNMGYPKFMKMPNTMEPVYPEYGGNENWVSWFLRQQENQLNSPISYVQIGQENGFGWDRIGPGLEMQLKLVKQLSDEGKIVVEKLSKTGQWYKENFALTPRTVSVAEEDWANGERRSYWYCNRNYRANIYKQANYVWIRDIFHFDSQYPERFLEKNCTDHSTIFDNLPVLDGFQWSSQFVRAGIYPVTRKNGEAVSVTSVSAKNDGDTLCITLKTDSGDIVISLGNIISLKSPQDIVWSFKYDSKKSNIKSFEKNNIIYEHNDFTYKLALIKGRVFDCSYDGQIVLLPENGLLTLEVEGK